MLNITQIVIFMIFCMNATLSASYLIRFALEKKPKSNFNIHVYVLIGSSVIWSLGMGLMSLQTYDNYAYIFRTIGILGTFVFMIGSQYVLNTLSDISARLKRIFILISWTGIPIFIAYSTPGQTIFVRNFIGTTFYFKPGIINILYSAYFVVVSANLLFVTVDTINRSQLKQTVTAGKRLLTVELFIFIGAIFDMALPSLGIPALPGSAITHFWGVTILWIATHEMFNSQITISNMSEYVYRSLSTPVLIFNAQNRLEIINSAAASFFGLEEEYFTPNVVRIEDLFEADSVLFSFEENDATRKATCKANGANCEISISRIKNSYNDTIGYICLVNDLTEHELVINKLQQAKLAADSANLSKSLFLANMSHEIRTPLNAILGFSDIALMENIDETSKGYFTEIKQAGNILLAVINDILNISKIELGQNEVDNTNYKSARLIKDVELITASNATKKGLAFEVNIDPSFPAELNGDVNKIREILLNLLGNAVKYTNVGKVLFRGSASINEDNTATVRFEITDSGIGIRKEDFEKIFDKFSRVDAKLTSSTEGTGLGLAITKGLVEMLGGTINVQSEYGVGTTFTVEIPQKVVSSTPIELLKNELADTTEAQLSAQLQNCHFLVVDDSKVNLKVATKFLEKYGAAIDTCLSGPEAIEKCKVNNYDIIFMDHMMPEMDGVEAMKKIRMFPGYETGSKQKIVALTANAVDTAKDLLLSEGFDDFISKPIKKDVLDNAISRILSVKL